MNVLDFAIFWNITIPLDHLSKLLTFEYFVKELKAIDLASGCRIA